MATEKMSSASRYASGERRHGPPPRLPLGSPPGAAGSAAANADPRRCRGGGFSFRFIGRSREELARGVSTANGTAFPGTPCTAPQKAFTGLGDWDGNDDEMLLKLQR